MTTATWILVDHALALLSVVAWFAAGVTMSLRRAGLALALLVVALLVTWGRGGGGNRRGRGGGGVVEKNMVDRGAVVVGGAA
ncbi:hypothetical protein, partial [Nocardia gipuzkoensis]|uniref:hypothetical protein n=1 Tax=Nocardia gipuzkoensis TaxID=2749991 RepID=UPI0024552BFB